MPKNISIVKQPNHTFYLVQKLETNDIYQRSKLITEFIEKETKKLEFVVNSEIKALLREKGINILSSRENEYIKALDTLKCHFHKTIDIVDLYKGQILENCAIVGTSPNEMTVVLEGNEWLQVGIQVVEVDII